ncbi:MAG: UDP-4-amino-4,6-dideoxy-N-acetyl-beta-L-altrosamine transaminase, partial [Candidatus Scalindua sp.]
MIPYARQDINQDDIDAVVEVLQSDWITQGPVIEKFENCIKDYCGAKHAIAVCNGTAALHLACLAMGLGKGDILWTSPNTFVASANCALYCDANVDFVDIDPRTYNLSVKKLEEKFVEAKKANKLPKVLVAVHFAGQSCDMEQISRLAKKYSVRVIEDASHAIGGDYNLHKIGSGRYSDITVFSFHPVKIITTGEGGILLTNDQQLANSIKLLRTHGITRETDQLESEADGSWYYEQQSLGYNYRITDIQAALGLSQMKRIDDFIQRRQELATRYDAELAGMGLTLPFREQDRLSAMHLYVVRIPVN